MSDPKTIRLRHHLFHTLWQVTAMSFCVFWYFHVPKSSKALLVLAGVAALMMLMDMHPVHKAIYVVVVISLILTENRAIDKERTEGANAEARQRQQESQQFQGIANGLTAAIEQSQKQFGATMGRMEHIAK